ncbi:MAG TPA: hypothetical protein VK186_06770 [Candidatus Deferrimicrobium sp.]|nr:hypothetical protein [Candidatus Deferrimicrobium sp.]
MKLRYNLIFFLALLGLLLQGGCGLFRVYEIEGTWKIEKDVNGVKTTLVAEFKGSRDYGDVIVDANTWGEYLVNFDDELVFTIAYFEPGIPNTDRKDTFTGGFDGHDTMVGTVEVVDVSENIKQTGQWTAFRETGF